MPVAKATVEGAFQPGSKVLVFEPVLDGQLREPIGQVIAGTDGSVTVSGLRVGEDVWLRGEALKPPPTAARADGFMHPITRKATAG